MNSIKRLRDDAGVNQKEVADRLNLSVSQYSRIERAPEKATWAQLRTIAQILGVSPAELLKEFSETTLADGLTIARLYLSLPVLEADEVRNLGAIKHKPSREYLAPSQNLAADCFWTKIDNSDNAPALEKGDYACWSPSAALAPSDIVLAEGRDTGELIIGRYHPLHASNPDAPGFVVRPVSAPHGEARFTVGSPGKVVGRLMERRQRF